MNVIWSNAAREELDIIIAYIARESPNAAMRMDILLTQATARLQSFPASGRPGLVPGTRELIPHPSYRIVYEHDDRHVHVLAVIHTARQWPPIPEDGS